MKLPIAKTFATLAFCLPFSAPASANPAYPERPITAIVPFSPGTALDLVARVVAERVTQELGSPMVIDNRMGASGSIGTDAVAKAAPDGYTVLWTSPAHYLNQFLYKSLPYDAVENFTPITKISNAQLVLAVNKDSPFATAAELLDYARKHPNKLRYSSAGLGSTTQLSAALFNAMAGVEIEHVPYKSGGQALTDVMGGHVDMTFTAVATALSHAKAGSLKVLGVTGLKRSQSMPDVPTLDEAGVPGYELVSWSGALAPKGTPPEIIEKLNAAMVKVAQDPEVQARLVSMGVEPDLMPTDVFAKQIQDDLPKWKKIADLSGAAEK